MTSYIKHALFLLLFCYISGTAQLPSLFNESIPVQQFVASEPENQTTDDNTSKAMITEPTVPLSGVNPNPRPAPDEEGSTFPAIPPNFPVQPTLVDPQTTTSTLELTDTTRNPQPLSTLEFFANVPDAPTTAQFPGGMSEANFIKCERMGVGVCSRATNDADFQGCLAQLKQQPACEEFLKFASLASFGLNDQIDLVQHYKEAQLTLVHVIRNGENYTGDFYTISSSGNFVNITKGPAIKGINISKDVHFPEIAMRYPKAQLWSIVEQLPIPAASPGGGLRLIFRFALLNGCATCDRAGYANVAYDFSGTGILQGITLLSLHPILPE